MNSTNIGQATLPVIEEFYTIQGEGFHTGRAAYFIRLAGCDVACPWCDTRQAWSKNAGSPTNIHLLVKHAQQQNANIVVITGGEPCMHPLEPITQAVHDAGMRIHLETSGTYAISGSWDWIALSPKPHREPLQQNLTIANELKIVISSELDLRWAKQMATKTNAACHLQLQPEWAAREHSIPLAVEFVKRNPQWRISLQTHKFMQIP
ncbi:MAG: 7-carboxy-7-deazaguanine synthase QueE [Bacteroidales bacterium]|nr:7-carboxy-7-deazaguanine synthase QueE [Bacteroidales bacterium]